MILLSALLTLSGVAVADDVGGIRALLTEHAAHAVLPMPLPDAEGMRALLDGQVVRYRVAGTPNRAVVMVLTDLSLRDVWLGSIDADMAPPEDVLVHTLPTTTGLLRWYGFIDIPQPFDDRHFLVETFLNQGMSEMTGGRIWERYWQLESAGLSAIRPLVQRGEIPGVDLDLFQQAIYLPRTEGAWVVAQVPDGRTLLAYHCATDVGGVVPEGAISRWILAGLDDVADTVLRNADLVPSHYSGKHPAITGGDGVKIPVYP